MYSIQSIFRFFNQKISTKKVHIDNCNLKKHGVFYKKSFLKNEYISKIFPNLQLPKNNIEKKIFLKDLFNTYSSSNNSSVKVRGEKSKSKIDYGMIDIEYPELLDKNDTFFLCSFERLIEDISALMPKDYFFNHFNIYFYSDCLSPRCLHLDSVKAKQLKAFIYLTDSNIEDGPYTYFISSNRNFFYNILQFILNILLGSDLGDSNTDGTLYSSKKATKICAQTGDLLFSDQRGIHGDMPKMNSGSGKAVLVLNFFSKNLGKYKS